ncbi:MAG: hypothetical protein BWX48_00083 [Verrucomicrobia bacterium ADurb.Bin006]|nr:MAG: hypothetical protein BWX48_00083 [Verrucomicrobia bacterium ADurb.Bin006]
MNHRDAEDTEKAMAGQSVFRPESVRDGLHTDSGRNTDWSRRVTGCDLQKQPCLDPLFCPNLHPSNPLLKSGP